MSVDLLGYHCSFIVHSVVHSVRVTHIQRPGMLQNYYRTAPSPPPIRIIWPKMSVVTRLRNPGLDVFGEESEVIFRSGASAMNGFISYLFCDE